MESWDTCGTEEKSFRLSQVLVDFVGDGNLSVCKRAEHLFVSRAHVVVNIIKK